MHHTCISWNDGQNPRKIHLAPLTAFGIWEVVDKNNIERFVIVVELRKATRFYKVEIGIMNRIEI